MSEEVIYETREVLEGAYPRNRKTRVYLTHTLRVTGKGKPRPEYQEQVLCNRVQTDSICDAGSNPLGLGSPPTCPMCLRRDPRFERKKQDRAEL